MDTILTKQANQTAKKLEFNSNNSKLGFIYLVQYTTIPNFWRDFDRTRFEPELFLLLLPSGNFCFLSVSVRTQEVFIPASTHSLYLHTIQAETIQSKKALLERLKRNSIKGCKMLILRFPGSKSTSISQHYRHPRNQGCGAEAALLAGYS